MSKKVLCRVVALLFVCSVLVNVLPVWAFDTLEPSDFMLESWQKEIDFFDYPEKFSVSLPPDEPIGIVTPFASYYFKVEYNSEIKELWWDDEIVNEDEKAEKLRGLINLIRDIVESKQEYKELPEPRSGYL